MTKMDKAVSALINFIILVRCYSYLFLTAEPERHITVTKFNLTPVVKFPYGLTTDEVQTVVFKYNFFKKNITSVPIKGWIITAFFEDSKLAKIKGNNKFYIEQTNPVGNLTLVMEGTIAGRSKLRFRIDKWYPEDVQKSIAEDLEKHMPNVFFDFQVYITMKDRVIDKIFYAVVILLVMTANIGMGTQVISFPIFHVKYVHLRLLRL